jgi:hypothetical protein
MDGEFGDLLAPGGFVCSYRVWSRWSVLRRSYRRCQGDVYGDYWEAESQQRQPGGDDTARRRCGRGRRSHSRRSILDPGDNRLIRSTEELASVELCSSPASSPYVCATYIQPWHVKIAEKRTGEEHVGIWHNLRCKLACLEPLRLGLSWAWLAQEES